MSTDSRIRELERKWKESGSVEDEAAYLLERVRVGDLEKEKLELAAWLGQPAAEVVVSAPPKQAPLDYSAGPNLVEDQLDEALQLWAVPDNVIALWTAECASKALPVLERELPREKRPRRAVEAAQAYALGSANRKEVQRVCRAAKKASEKIRLNDASRESQLVALAAYWAAAYVSDFEPFSAQQCVRLTAEAQPKMWKEDRLRWMLRRLGDWALAADLPLAPTTWPGEGEEGVPSVGVKRDPTTGLPNRVVSKTIRSFEDSSRALAMLSKFREEFRQAYRENPGTRLLSALVSQSDGDLQSLEELCGLAMTDWRDVLR